MLALWEFFWTEQTWLDNPAPVPPPPPPPPVETPDTGAGSGKHRERKRYHRAGDDFWEVRERYLRRFVEPLAPPVEAKTPSQEDPAAPASAPDPMIVMRQVQAEMLQRARMANNAADLLHFSAKLHRITLDIAAQHEQNFSRAVTILLLDFF